MLEENDIKKLKSMFKEYLDLLDSKKNINEQIKGMIEEASDTTRIKKSIIRKVFNFLKKEFQDGNNELDDISTLFTQLRE